MTAPLLGPFTQLDPPTNQTLNQPPALPTFVDGDLVHQSDLNALSANLQYLQTAVLGGTQGGTSMAVGKPLTVLRAVTANTFTSGAAPLIKWDTADINNNGAWSFTADPYTIYVQTEGYYRILFQCGTTLSTSHWSQCSMFILINGTDVTNNSVSSCSWYGNQGNLEITVPLAATASVQVAYMQTSGSSCTSTTNYGGARLECEWIAPTIPAQTSAT